MRFTDLEDYELKEKYAKKVNYCVGLILSVFNELKDADSYRFLKYGKNLQFIKPEIDDLQKRAWYNGGIIYLTEDVLCQK